MADPVTGKDDTTATAAAPAGRPVRVYDFRRPKHLSGEQVKNLHRAHAAAAEAIQSRLGRFLGVNLDVRLEGTEEIAYGLFADALQEHTYVNVLDLAPLHERGLLLLDSTLCLAFVDRVLGGQCKTAPKSRTLTAIDQAGAESSIESILRCLREAWKDVFPIKLAVLDRRTSPDQVQLIPRGDPVLAVTFLAKGECGEGRFRLCLPVNGLKAATGGAQKTSAVKPTAEKASAMRANMLQSLEKATLPVMATVGTADVPLGAMMKMKVGDILRLDQAAEAPVLLKVGRRPAFWGKMGLRGRRKAIQLVDRVNQTEED